MNNLARGYIASGEFNCNRVAQHLQNQIIKAYCDTNDLEFVLSRAEYWINGSTKCQLWAALREGFSNLVFFSVWQLPEERSERVKIYEYCKKQQIILHFSVERIHSDLKGIFFADIEILYQSNMVILQCTNYYDYLSTLNELL